jgi:glycosyltransferase involved in cell wall biosynthesis
MGKSWDLPDLIPTLGRLKQTQKFKLIHLVHDMIPILEPHLFGPGLFEPYTDCLFEVCSLSDGILTVSQSTKKDVQRFCKMLAIPVPPIDVVHLGDDFQDVQLAADEPAPDPRIEKNFILQVGTIEVRKNHLLTYLAYREAALQGIELPQFVIVGGRGWLTDNLIWQIEHDPVVKDKILLLSGISDRGRVWMYKNCRFTVSPSTYEGWGMPIGESLAYGKVCITSKTSSTPEVGKELADYVSPYNTQEMLDALTRYIDDKKLAKREQEIAKNYPVATWDTTFKQVSGFTRKLAV